jgi:hypothetical protein
LALHVESNRPPPALSELPAEGEVVGPTTGREVEDDRTQQTRIR